MSFNYNQVTLVGRLTRDPELKIVSDNFYKLKLTVAVSRPKRKDQPESETDFIPVVLFGTPASIGERLLKKGSPILIWGRMQVRTYEKENEKNWITEVVGENFQLLEKLPERHDVSANEQEVVSA